MNTKLDNIINPTEQVTKTEGRIKSQIESGVEVFDVKVDLLQYMRQTERIKHSKIWSSVAPTSCRPLPTSIV